MDCNAIVTWEMLLRRAVRLVGGSTSCTAIAVDTSLGSSSVVPCNAPSLLSLVAMAIPDDQIRASFSTGGDIGYHDCNDLPPKPLSELIGYVIYEGLATNSAVFSVHEYDPLAVVTCDRECDESLLSTEELIRRTFVTAAGNKWTMQVYFDTGDAITCDDIEVPTEQLIRAAIFPVGNGTYAWRLIQEVA